MVIVEIFYIGWFGVEVLVVMVLVFFMVILIMMMFGGVMGGVVVFVIVCVFGVGNCECVGVFVVYVMMIGIIFGFVFMLGMLIFGFEVLEMFGGCGDVLIYVIVYM